MYRYIGIIIAILTTSVSSYICISQNKKINELKRNLELKRNNNKGVSFNDVIDENNRVTNRGKKLDKIIKDIENNQSFRATLGGCIIEKVNETVIISKEH